LPTSNYIEGRKLHYEGEDRQGILLMEKAVAVDPEFAMAYRSMAVGYANLGYNTEAREHMQKAMQLAERISDRERYTIQEIITRNQKRATIRPSRLTITSWHFIPTIVSATSTWRFSIRTWKNGIRP